MWLVDLVIAFTLLEGVGLSLRHRLTGQGLPPRQLLPNLAAGLCLLIGLRLMLAGVGEWALAACLAGSGVAHLVDLRQR